MSGNAPAPLYTFRLDTAAGQAHGNNDADSFNGTDFTWRAVTASGKGSTDGPAPAPSYGCQSGYRATSARTSPSGKRRSR